MLFLINKYKSTVIIVINIISIRENLLIVRGVMVEAKPSINKILKKTSKKVSKKFVCNKKVSTFAAAFENKRMF